MALISMAVHDTVENKRTWMTGKTLDSLLATVNWDKHRLFIIDNDSCSETQIIYKEAAHLFPFTLIHNQTNIGTARAINKAWQQRSPGENAIKMDNDVVIHDKGWVDKLEECLARDPKIGIIGLKRKDLAENPWCAPGSWEHSDLAMLSHEPGQTWLLVEKVNHVMGTCQMYSSALLDKIGYLYQMGGLYGFDDALSAVRCQVAGFYSCFYPHCNIDHIDPGGTADTTWKAEYAGQHIHPYNVVVNEYRTGKRSIYQGPNDE